MLHDNDTERTNLLLIKQVFYAWFIWAVILIPVVSLILHYCDAEYAIVSYCSSALSFVCSMIAGIKAQRVRGGGAVYTGVIAGLMLCVSLLTAGFLISGGSIQPDGIISVASFSISGALAGSVLCSQKRAKRGPKSRVKKENGVLT